MFQWFKDNVFNDVGRKIQSYAIITLIIDIIACVFLAIFALVSFSDGWLVSLMTLGFGLGYALIFAMPIYAFGQLVEDIHQTNVNTAKQVTPDEDEIPEL